MTIRTSIIGEERGTSRNLLEWARSQKGKTVNGYTNHFWNGVTTVYLAEIIEKIVANGLYKPGLFHIYSLDTVSKYSLMEIFSEVYDLQFTINAFKAPEAIDRSMTSIYDLSAKVSTLTVREQVFRMHTFFKTE
jgi:dTDP-4-dehydrorhamnose reductase